MAYINPRPINIHEGSSQTTLTVNTANVLTPFASILVPDNKMYALRSGVVMNGQFKTTGAVALLDGSEIVLAYMKAGEDLWKPVEGAKLLMSGFNNTTKANQQTTEYDAPRTFSIVNGKGYEAFEAGDRIGILLKATTVAGTSATYSFFKLPMTEYTVRK